MQALVQFMSGAGRCLDVWWNLQGVCDSLGFPSTALHISINCRSRGHIGQFCLPNSRVHQLPILEELGYPTKKHLYGDSKAGIAMVANDCGPWGTRHLRSKLRELVLSFATVVHQAHEW